MRAENCGDPKSSEMFILRLKTNKSGIVGVFENLMILGPCCHVRVFQKDTRNTKGYQQYVLNEISKSQKSKILEGVWSDMFERLDLELRDFGTSGL